MAVPVAGFKVDFGTNATAPVALTSTSVGLISPARPPPNAGARLPRHPTRLAWRLPRLASPWTFKGAVMRGLLLAFWLALRGGLLAVASNTVWTLDNV